MPADSTRGLRVLGPQPGRGRGDVGEGRPPGRHRAGPRSSARPAPARAGSATCSASSASPDAGTPPRLRVAVHAVLHEHRQRPGRPPAPAPGAPRRPARRPAGCCPPTPPGRPSGPPTGPCCAAGVPTKCQRGAASGRSRGHLGHLGGGLLHPVLAERGQPEVEQQRRRRTPARSWSRPAGSPSPAPGPRRGRPSAIRSRSAANRRRELRRPLPPPRLRPSACHRASPPRTRHRDPRSSVRIPSARLGVGVEPGDRGLAAGAAVAAVAVEVARLQGAARVAADPGHAERGQLVVAGRPAGPGRGCRAGCAPPNRAARRPPRPAWPPAPRSSARRWPGRAAPRPRSTRAPSAVIAASVAGSTPAAAPTRPACAAPTTPAAGSASSTGTQSAASTASPIPGTGGDHGRRCPGCPVRPGRGGAVTVATRVPCTWARKTTGTPSARRTRARLAATAVGSSPTPADRLNRA